MQQMYLPAPSPPHTDSQEPRISPLEPDSLSLNSMPSLPSQPSTPDLPLRERTEATTKAQVREPPDFTLRRTTLLPTPGAPSRNDWVRLNVGGKIFATTRSVVCTS